MGCWQLLGIGWNRQNNFLWLVQGGFGGEQVKLERERGIGTLLQLILLLCLLSTPDFPKLLFLRFSASSRGTCRC